MVESIKEGGRLALFAGLSYLVTYLLQYFGAMDQTNNSIILGTFILRVADKYLHKIFLYLYTNRWKK